MVTMCTSKSCTLLVQNEKSDEVHQVGGNTTIRSWESSKTNTHTKMVIGKPEQSGESINLT